MAVKFCSKRALWCGASVFCALIASSVSSAQDGGGSVKVGEADFIPSVRLSYLTNSNAFLTPDDEIDSTALAVAPRFELIADRRLLEVALVYDGDYATYSEDELTYDDHRFQLTTKAELSSRKRLNAFVTLEKNHEVLGTGLTRGIADETTEQIERTEFEVGGSFAYGAAEARGNIEVGFSALGRNYLNQDILTEGRDSTLLEAFGLFSFRLSSSSRALLELRFGTFDFDEELRDHNDISVFAGISLAEGRKTSGTVKIGVTQADFSDDGTSDDESTFAAEISLAYKPVTFSTFDLTFSREFADNEAAFTGANSVETQTTARLGWNHQWSSRLRTDAFVRYLEEDRDCPDVGTEQVSGGLGFGLSIRRWLEIGADVRTASRTSGECDGVDSTVNDQDFDRHQIGVFTRITL